MVHCDHSAVSRIENGTYPLTPQMFRAVERLLTLGSAEGYETWFINYLEVERTATVLRSWEPLGVPGLLQTAVLRRRLGGTGMSAPAHRATASGRMSAWRSC